MNMMRMHGKNTFTCAIRTLVAVVIGFALPLAAADVVWVSDERGNDTTGDGTYEAPYKTIQKGVDEVDAGGTVKILRGIYGEGEEHFSNSHTNRVVIRKSITLDGVEGKDVTHIVGCLDSTVVRGNSSSAIRCIQIDSSSAKNTIIKNLTLRNGGAAGENKLWGYGGGVNNYQDAYGTVWVVDCVISNCAAVMGAAVHGVNAVRCKLSRCVASGYGSASRRARLLHCLIERCSAIGNTRPMLAYTTAVNCTVAMPQGSQSQGIGYGASAYNCVVFNSGTGTDIVSSGDKSVTETNHCYTTSTDAHLLFSPATDDFRLTDGTEAVGGGLTEFITSKITLPAGIGANIDLAGNTVDLTKETCDAGCYQGAVTPGGGRIYITTAHEFNGVSNGNPSAYVYYTPEAWPVSVRIRPYVDNITNYAYATMTSASYGYSSTMRRFYPLKDGSHILVPPPGTNNTLVLKPTTASLVLYASPDADPETADGTIEHPFATLQDAVVCATNATAESPLILALPGVYDKGGEEIGGVFTRLVLPSSKHFTVRSTEGAERTVIKGGVDESNTGYYAGCGPDAVRCIHVSRGDSTVTPSVIQGFTIADGRTKCDDYTTDANDYRGGAILGSGKNSKVTQLIDCIITNCAAVRCGASYNATLLRCKLYDCHGYGGVMRATRIACSYVDPSCTLGSAPEDATENAVFGNSTYATLTTAPDATIFNSDALQMNSNIFASSEPQSDVPMWGSVTTNETAIASSTGCAYLRNINFVDPANGDWRLTSVTPAMFACKMPAKGSSAYSKWSSEFPFVVQGDIDGNPIVVVDGKLLPGCWQTTTFGKGVYVQAANGGLSIPDGGCVDDPADFPLTIAPISGPRLCIGYEVDGVTNLFGTGNCTITAADVAASDSGLVLNAIYPTDWYVNPNDGVGDDVNNNGFQPSSPMKTLAAVMAKVFYGDTVHAAAGRYDEGWSMTGSDNAAWNMRARVVVPAGVTLVADDGPEETFIVGDTEPDSTKANDYGMGTNAMRCVFMYANTRLKGFTVTGGRTWWNSDGFTDTAYSFSGNWSGGGICGHSDGRADVYVEDCIISNNYACWAGAARFTNLIRCRLYENYAMSNGGALRDAHAYGCVIDRNYSGEGSNRASCHKYTKLVGCTLGPHNYKLNGDAAYAVNAASSNKAIFQDNLVLGETGNSENLTKTVTGCVFADACAGWPTNETCIVVPSAELEVDEDLRPIVGRNVAVDRASIEDVSAHSGGLIPSETDALGFMRVMNGVMDVGALEGDWRPMYAKILDGRGTRLEVTAASGGIVTNDVDGVAAVELHGGEALSLTWGTAAFPAVRRGFVKVTGEGTLTVTLNGAPFGAYTVTDGAAEFAVPAAGLDALAFTFAFDGEGVADLYGFSAKVGTVFSIR